MKLRMASVAILAGTDHVAERSTRLPVHQLPVFCVVMALTRSVKGPANSGLGGRPFARYTWLVPASSQWRAELVLSP